MFIRFTYPNTFTHKILNSSAQLKPTNEDFHPKLKFSHRLMASFPVTNLRLTFYKSKKIFKKNHGIFKKAMDGYHLL